MKFTDLKPYGKKVVKSKTGKVYAYDKPIKITSKKSKVIDLLKPKKKKGGWL